MEARAFCRHLPSARKSNPDGARARASGASPRWRGDGRWDAEIRVRRTFTEDKPHVEVVTCRKPTATVAEQRGVIYARRWVDRHGAG
jgi:hypothetical protein